MGTTEPVNVQVAPYPAELAAIIAQCTYRPGWQVQMDDIVRDPASTHAGESRGLTLIITTLGYDSYHPEHGEHYRVNHFFPVPPATFNRASWLRWLFDRFVEVETHEAMEFFTIDGEKPYAPNHGPGESPYIVHDPTDDTARRTSFRGVIKSE